MRENARQRGQFLAVSRSLPKYIVPVESISTCVAAAIVPFWPSRPLSRQRLVLDPVWLRGFFALAPLQIFHVVLEVTFEPYDFRVAFESQNVGGDAIQEPTVVRYDNCAAREGQQGLFQGTQGLDVQVVGGFVEHEHVAA